MDDMQQTIVSLPEDVAAMLEDRITSGEYATAGEAIRDGLNALRSWDLDMEGWLRRDVARSFDDFLADPTTSIPAEEMMNRVRASYVAKRRALGGR